jgi:uncharacterized protein YggE
MSREALLAVAVAATLVVAAVGVVGLGSAGSDAPADDASSRTITVSATGTAEAAPDQAVVRVSVTVSGNDSAAVRSTLSSDADALRSALDELDVEYETARYTIRERPPERRGERGDADAPAYRGEHAFEVTVDDPNDTGAVIDAAADVGAEVDTVQLTLSDEKRTALRDDAIENAMTDARSQASTIANAANLTVTVAASVDASESQYAPVRYETAAAGGDAGGGGATNVDAGDVSVTYTVRVTYNASA